MSVTNGLTKEESGCQEAKGEGSSHLVFDVGGMYGGRDMCGMIYVVTIVWQMESEKAKAKLAHVAWLRHFTRDVISASFHRYFTFSHPISPTSTLALTLISSCRDLAEYCK